jgi:solute carrier family 34 (sodium-dependent phosphate cotransporter)
MLGGRFKTVLKCLGILGALYLFIVGVGGMGHAFKMFGKEFSEKVLATTASPFAGLFIGIMATAIVQSSSTTTSIIVGMVAGGAISLTGAIPMIMGANIGTTLTSLLVSLGHINRPGEFRRAFSAASLHLSFNIMAVAIMFPLQATLGIISTPAESAAQLFRDVGGMRLSDPLRMATAPAIAALEFLVFKHPVLLLGVCVLLTLLTLIALVKLLRSLVIEKVESFFDEHLFKTAWRALVFGFFLTVAVQSSSIPTSLVIPLAAAGVLKLIQIYPFSLGANVGTTVTAMLAALSTGSEIAMTVAISHLIFNLLGILVIWCVPPLRRIPLIAAEWVAQAAMRNRLIPVSIIALVFFVIPSMVLLIIR